MREQRARWNVSGGASPSGSWGIGPLSPPAPGPVVDQWILREKAPERTWDAAGSPWKACTDEYAAAVDERRPLIG